jgi:hypothetical protein
MSSTLAGLGAIAGGLSRGLADGQRLAGDMEDRAYQRDQRLRQRTLQDRDDALNADLEAANAAMRERLQGFASEHSRTQGPGPRNNLLLGGTDGSMPDQTANDTPSAAPAGFRPTEEQLLDAAQARTNTLFARGRHDAAVKQTRACVGSSASRRPSAGCSPTSPRATSRRCCRGSTSTWTTATSCPASSR